jgi:prepilin-type N-terminal cleavage/methylation domain-containing protein
MQTHAEHNRAQAGFTLLETIVALVILTAGLMGFYSFLVTMLNGANRLQGASIAYDRQANALELAKTLNPMDAPEGTFDLGSYRIQWSSQLLKNVRQSSRYPTGAGVFKVALYRVTFRFPDDDGISPLEVTKLGYHRDTVPFQNLRTPPPTASN